MEQLSKEWEMAMEEELIKVLPTTVDADTLLAVKKLMLREVKIALETILYL